MSRAGWVPSWAAHFLVEAGNSGDKHLIIRFYIHSNPDTLPLHQLRKTLLDADVLQQMADKPLASRVKQPRYTDERGEDFIDEFERTESWPEFVAAMSYNIRKYLRRLGKKDDEVQELEKVADYAERLLQAAKRRIDTHV